MCHPITTWNDEKMELDVKEIFENIKEKHNFSFSLKPKQISLIENVVKGKHSVGILPTGYGKSICFQILPVIMEEYFNKKTTVLVFSPLKSLMFDQCQKTSDHNIPSVCLTQKGDMTTEEIEGIKKGDYSLIYLSPEILLKFNFWSDILLESDIYQKQMCAIVVDEVHLLETWGTKFRPTFSKLGELRSHFTKVPFLLLTATCTDKILESVLGKTFIKDPVIESISPDRPNIFIKYVSEAGMKPLEQLEWYFNEIKEKGVGANKAILYVRSVNVVGTLYRDVMGQLRDYAYKDMHKCYENRLVGVYHAGLEDSDQKKIVNLFNKTNSVIRFLLCTVAFGLGVDIPDVRYVMHWGVSDSVLQYWQEIGRAGRDGQKATAYYYAVRASVVNAEEDMKVLIQDINKGNIKCVRQAILGQMIGGKQANNSNSESGECKLCNCCSLCKGNCQCEQNK